MNITKEQKKGIKAGNFDYVVFKIKGEVDEDGIKGEITFRGSNTRKRYGIEEKIDTTMTIPLMKGDIISYHSNHYMEDYDTAQIHLHSSETYNLMFWLMHIPAGEDFRFEMHINDGGTAVTDAGLIEHALFVTTLKYGGEAMYLHRSTRRKEDEKYGTIILKNKEYQFNA